MRQDWLGLSDKRVVVVGAGGLGAACALGFAQVGAKVLVVDRDEERLALLHENAEFQDAKGQTAAFDLSEPDSGTATVNYAIEVLGGVDVALHCIGVNDRRPILEFNDDEWQRIIEINLSTGFRFAQAAGRLMSEQGSGRVIFLSSVSGLLAHKNHGPYAASKGGINQLMRVMAAEWASSGVTVNAIAPGYVETPLTAEHLANPGVRESLTHLVPAGRLGTPDEVVGPVLFLASQHSSFVTGHVLYVDGGRTLV